ncbi:PEP-CTERM sorting domain-containing protein [Luteolibacter pohnpeiensis]|uniref:PEP-CTERM sorting domain-containing protein n=1 Tax=Luteolibacter pohnpeiensis TaxID=454153 RepID=A0A934S435_9BACT|nr:PEP-CTERM sorting domain-containing protein [Luteolibacter pohnpeiensis]MBK1882116.1 PEP-CTERM sorting domain-containing protein [Luteolibacter pohnpeiensis]
MKIKATMVAALLLLAPALHAFTLDFASSVGATLPSDLVINVPGYGDVSFSANYASSLEVGTDFYGGATLQFDNNEVVLVTFLGGVPTDVDFSTVAVSAISGEQFVVIPISSSQYAVALQGSTDGAGIGAVTFNAAAVPEPSSAVLGLLGAAGLFVRRRR